MLRQILVVVHENCQVLDVAGPIAALSAANDLFDDEKPYSIKVLAREAGIVSTNSAMSIVADFSWNDLKLTEFDTLMVVGGSDTRRIAQQSTDLTSFVRESAKYCRRVVGICTGVFFLAEAGLLKERRVVTHWDSAVELAATYPDTKVERDAIYIEDGRYWSSAGVTAGIDLTLHLIEGDVGSEVALAVARRLVVYKIRQGGQTQFSAHLDYHLDSGSRFKSLIAWLEGNLTSDLSVGSLARRCNMSERNFARCFTKEVGISPGRFVTSLQIEHARMLLERTTMPFGQVAIKSGFGSYENFRRTLWKVLRVTPKDYRERFYAVSPPATALHRRSSTQMPLDATGAPIKDRIHPTGAALGGAV